MDRDTFIKASLADASLSAWKAFKDDVDMLMCKEYADSIGRKDEAIQTIFRIIDEEIDKYEKEFESI